MVNLVYSHHQHLSGIYVGLELLRRQNKINFKFDFSEASKSQYPLLNGSFNSKSFCIDCLDGYNWIEGSLADNLNYFKVKFNYDFVIKRNFNLDLSIIKPESTFLNLGFNYAVGLSYFSFYSFFSNFWLNPYWYLRYIRLLSGYFDYRSFEVHSIFSNDIKILYQVRLWNPLDAKNLLIQEQRKQMNLFRISCVRALKKNFSSIAITGVEDSDYARSVCPDLVISKQETMRLNYFNHVRRSSICVTSNGLHNSIGWKMGEYVAASKAIVCENPYFLFPPNFLEGQNYLGFSTPEELLIQVDKLLSQPNEIKGMMNSNHEYYQNYQRPDKLVWNIFSQMLE